LTFVIGVPFAYMGAITRTHYGPDTARAVFETDVSAVVTIEDVRHLDIIRLVNFV
jgi:hypothetical protein